MARTSAHPLSLDSRVYCGAVTHPADVWRAELRSRLLAARKARDDVSTRAFRSAMSVIDNAETPDGPVPAAGALADSAQGPGAAEVTRRSLTDAEVRALLQAEVDELTESAAQLTAGGRTDRADEVLAEARVLVAVLEDV